MIVIIFQLKSQVTLAGVRFMDRFNNNISAILNDPLCKISLGLISKFTIKLQLNKDQLQFFYIVAK